MSASVGATNRTRPSRWLVAAALAALVAWALFARWRGLVGPFGTGWQWLGSWYAMQARNLLRYGPVETCFAGVVNPDRVAPSEWVYYLHHPPGTIWSMAVSFELLGESAFASKLPALLAALGQVVVTWFLVARVLSRSAASVAALMTAALPAGARFTTHGSELGPAVVCFSLLALLLDERARDRSATRPPIAPPLAAFFGAALFSWAALPVAIWIAARDLVSRRYARALVFGLAAPAALALHLLHVRLATGTFGGGDYGSLAERIAKHGASGIAEATERVGIGAAALRIVHHLRELFTDAALLTAIAGLLLLLSRPRIAPLRALAIGPLFLALLVLAAGYSVPFPQAVWFHSYWMLLALPLTSLLCGVVMEVAGVREWSRWIAAAGFLLLASLSTIESRAAQALEETPLPAELGSTLRAQTESGDRILSTESPSSTLVFYADRKILGNVTDRDHDAWVASGGVGVTSPKTLFALVLPRPPDAQPYGRLEEFLRKNYDSRVFRLAESRRELTLFDMSRRR